MSKKIWEQILICNFGSPPPPKKKTKKPSYDLLQTFRLFEKPSGSFIQVGYRSLYSCKNIGSRNYNRIATDRRTGGYHPGRWQTPPPAHLVRDQTVIWKKRGWGGGGDDNRPTLALTCSSYYYTGVLRTTKNHYVPTHPTQWPPPHPIRPNTLFNAHPFSAPHLIRAMDDHRVGAGAGLTGFRVALFLPIVTRVGTF